jgi:peptidoglycan/xylan/chitin deacetylase (PgdA/CDA1 family)
MALSSMGLMPKGQINRGVPTEFLRLRSSPPDKPRGENNSEAEREEKIAFLAEHEIEEGDRSRRIVLMTYDDQGHRVWIDRILDAYALVGGKATFFFTGNNLNHYAEQIQRIVREGHVFGCHGLEHVPHTSLRSDELRSQLRQWLEMVDEIVPGYQVRFFRFPYGDRNDRVRRVIAEFGFQNVHWNVESGGLDEDTFERVVGKVSNGSIVLSHMCRFYDVDQAERILEYLTEEGYGIESVERGIGSGDLYGPEDPRPRLNYPQFLLEHLEP